MKDKRLKDEYDWNKYTKEYSDQITEMEATSGDNGSEFIITKLAQDKDGDVLFCNKLHANWKELYRAAYWLKPKSIYEVGCGALYHLINLGYIVPRAKLSGSDLLQSQIDFGTKKFNPSPRITQNVTCLDFSGDIGKIEPCEFVFCHAVLMHLSYAKALAVIKNMMAISNSYIMMIEGQRQHDFESLFVDSGMNQWQRFSANKFVGHAFLFKKP